MVRFGILNYPVFLPVSSLVLLLADASVMAISYVIASVIKTSSRS
jgi:hypothetical protein